MMPFPGRRFYEPLAIPPLPERFRAVAPPGTQIGHDLASAPAFPLVADPCASGRTALMQSAEGECAIRRAALTAPEGNPARTNCQEQRVSDAVPGSVWG